MRNIADDQRTIGSRTITKRHESNLKQYKPSAGSARPGDTDLAEAIPLGEKKGPEKGLLLDVLEQTAVLTPGQKAKLANVKREQYPTQFALSLIHKDLLLVLDEAYTASVPMPATARGMETANFSILIRFMKELTGMPGVAEAPGTA